jgi:hypothetical protein
VAAEDIYWVGYQNDCMVSHPDVGSFFHDDNWLNYTVPGSDDAALFGTGFDPGQRRRPAAPHPLRRRVHLRVRVR